MTARFVFLVAMVVSLASPAFSQDDLPSGECVTRTIGGYTFVQCSDRSQAVYRQIGSYQYGVGSNGLQSVSYRSRGLTYTRYSTRLPVAAPPRCNGPACRNR